MICALNMTCALQLLDILGQKDVLAVQAVSPGSQGFLQIKHDRSPVSG